MYCRQLCEAVTKLISHINTNKHNTASTSTSEVEIDPEIESNCAIMTEKLNLLLETLQSSSLNEARKSTKNKVLSGDEEESSVLLSNGTEEEHELDEV